jgi:hypothetical protein
MKREDIEQVLREFVDGKAILGGSLVRADGKTVASYCVGIDSATLNLMARDSFSAKRRRGTNFPILGSLNFSMTIYEGLSVGLASISEKTYVQLVAKPELPLQAFHSKLRSIAEKLEPHLL